MEEEKKKKIHPALDDPPPKPEPEPEPEEEEDENEDDLNGDAAEDALFEEKVLEVLKKHGLLPVPAPETEPAPENKKDEVKAERERIMGLMAYSNVVSESALKGMIEDGSGVQELALRVLAERKAELENKRALLASAAKKEEPLSDYCFEEETKTVKKSTVNSLAAVLMPRPK